MELQYLRHTHGRNTHVPDVCKSCNIKEPGVRKSSITKEILCLMRANHATKNMPELRITLYGNFAPDICKSCCDIESDETLFIESDETLFDVFVAFVSCCLLILL